MRGRGEGGREKNRSKEMEGGEGKERERQPTAGFYKEDF